MLHDVAETLGAINVAGAFATRSTAPSGDLRVTVKDVGAIRFPISPAVAHKLRGVARPAGFGWRDKTRVDKAVRDTWEIARSRVKIDRRQWKNTLDPELARIQRDMGLPVGGRFEAQFYKMLVYGPEQFFVPHQDSERAASMVGTLTVALPSEYKGGAVVIDHRGEKITYRATRGSTEQLTFIAFYSDCHHEVRPIKDGYRVVLVYNLLFHAPTLTVASVDNRLVNKLVEHVDSHLTTPVPAGRYSKEPARPPDKLVYLLDHEYTQHSLGWDRLKSDDRPRAAALLAAAEPLDCEIFLSLADVHESWSCEGEYYADWDPRQRRYDGYDDDERDPESYDLIDLCDGDVDLRHWIDASGKPAKNASGVVSSDELCFTKASVDCEPFKSEHEGWMGNYGNTVDRWYHRAAVVMWPRSKSFVIRAKLSPDWAIDQLRGLLRANALHEARAKAQSLLPFWSGYASRKDDRRFVTKTLQIAVALNSAKLASELLAPFRLDQLGVQAVPNFVALLKAHGLAWSRDLFQLWAGRARYYHRRDERWLKLIPKLCRALCENGAGDGRELAHWIIAHQWSVFEKECKSQLEDPAHPHSLSQLTESSKKLIWLLEGCIAAENDDAHADIVRFLVAPDTRYPVKCLVAALQDSRKHRRSPEELRALRLNTLYRHCMNELTIHLETPARAANDWSIAPPQACACELCKELAEFLAHRDRVRFEWPLAKQKRMHVHRHLDGYNLPVTHTTRRQGRPYTLVLAKTKAVFARDANLRETRRRELAWLARQQDSFVGPTARQRS